MGEKIVLGAIHSEGLDSRNIEFEFPVGMQNSKFAIGLDTSKYAIDDPDFTVEGSSSRIWARFSLPEATFLGMPLRREFGLEHSASQDDLIVSGSSSPSQDRTTSRVYASASTNWTSDSSNLALNFNAKVTLGDLDLSRIQSVYDGDLAGAQTHGDFAKLNFDVAGQFRVNAETSLTATATCQVTNKNLGSDDEIDVSGPSAVRAYAIGSVSGDQGCYLQSELIRQFTEKTAGYIFSDMAYVQTNKSLFTDWQVDEEENRFGIMSAGLGLRMSLTDEINLSLSYAHRIGGCDGCASPQADGQFWGLITGSF